jgi:hypothetical protein
LELGNDRYITVNKYKKDLYISIKKYITKMDGTRLSSICGVTLSLVRFAKLRSIIAEVDSVKSRIQSGEEAEFDCHIGGGIHVTVNKIYDGVDIRKYFLPIYGRSSIASDKGIELRYPEWDQLVLTIAQIDGIYEEVANAVTCESKHFTTLGRFMCNNCNPFGEKFVNDFINS